MIDTLDVKDKLPTLTALPRNTSIEQALNIQEQRIVNEQTSKFDVSEKTPVIAKDNFEECDLLSKKSLERVSPPKFEDKVIFTLAHKKYIFVEAFALFYYRFASL